MHPETQKETQTKSFTALADYQACFTDGVTATIMNEEKKCLYACEFLSSQSEQQGESQK